MNITITVRNRIASVRDSPPPEIINGNSGYVLCFDWDSEWDAFEAVTCCVVLYTATGSTRSTYTVSSGTVTLPPLHDTYAIEVGLTAGDVYTTTPARIACIACITDGDAEEAATEFDVYNAMMEYLSGVQSGSHNAEELAVMYQELIDYMNSLPDPEEFPSTAYRRAIAAPQRITRITGTLTLPDGTEQTLSEREIIANTLGIRTDCMTDDCILPGSVPTAELTVSLRGQAQPEALYGAEIAPIFGIRLSSGKWYDVPLGVFTISAADSTAEQNVSITGYDDMQRLSQIPRNLLGIVNGQAYTAQEIIVLCAGVLELEIVEIGDFVNTDVRYILSNADSRIETARDLLMYAVQTLGAFAYVDRFRKLCIKSLKMETPAVTISAIQRKTLTASRKEYRLYQLNVVYEYPDEDDNMLVRHDEFQTLWADGITTELPENPLWAVIDAEQRYHRGVITQCIVRLINLLDPIVFTPLTAETLGDPSIEPFEWRTFRRNSESFTAPITAIDWYYHGTQTVQAAGADAVAGILRSQAEKKALAVRISTSQSADNVMRDMYLQLILTTGHAGMAQRTHDWLAHYTHGELSGEERIQ